MSAISYRFLYWTAMYLIATYWTATKTFKYEPESAYSMNAKGMILVSVLLFGVMLSGCSCKEEWECEPWTACVGGMESRLCYDVNQCGTIKDKPPTSQPCCEENWECGDWGECLGGVQSRNCTDLNDCGTFEDVPEVTKDCCEENWECGNWSGCINGFQERTCQDLNSCGTTVERPVVRQACAVPVNKINASDKPDLKIVDIHTDPKIVQENSYFEFVMNITNRGDARTYKPFRISFTSDIYYLGDMSESRIIMPNSSIRVVYRTKTNLTEGNYSVDVMVDYLNQTDEADETNNICTAELEIGTAVTYTCPDNTPYGQCSSTRPQKCVAGTLVDNCSACGCPAPLVCSATGTFCEQQAASNFTFSGSDLAGAGYDTAGMTQEAAELTVPNSTGYAYTTDIPGNLVVFEVHGSDSTLLFDQSVHDFASEGVSPLMQDEYGDRSYRYPYPDNSSMRVLLLQNSDSFFQFYYSISDESKVDQLAGLAVSRT
ncbi:hypothetical protein GF351_00390 [Candidatus Woesearchaeota archaeon]|nr:hypothetical protein [Candidatus Woesearchaeota archaeon]